MTETPLFHFDADPGPALAELCRLLRFSQGEFTLIVAVCNATEHRQALVDQLRQSCPIPFQELTLAPEADTLFTTLHQAVGNPPPAALMVYGLESVQDLASLLVATNQIREEFRQFPFPLVLWLTDYGQRHLVRTAPDFYTWANIVSFPTPTDYFQRFLDELITSVWRQVITSQENRFLSTTELGLSPNSPRCRELEASLTALKQAGIALSLSQAASLAFVRGRIADNNTDEARHHYEDSLAQWQALADSPSPPPHSRENVGHLQFYLGLWWRNRSVRDRRQFEPACQTACDYFADTIATLTQAQCPEAIAKYINYWAEALHRLEQWDTLAQVAQQALTLHQSHQDSLRQARALGFLAEVALHHQDWLQAQTQAQTALQLLSDPTSTPDPTFLAWVNRFHRSWYLFSLGKAQFAQQHIEAAVSTLEQAIATTQPEYDPQLYSQVLDQLGQAYFQQGRYLEAFQTRRRKETIESRFNFRAFVGAGRLQPKQAVANPALPTHTLDRDAIAASGRKHDVQRLVYRLLQDGFTFTVIYGPSGVGKSSLLEAGLVPALEQERWEGRRVLPLRCGRYGNWAEDLLAQLGHDAGHPQAAEAVLDRIRLQTQRNRVIVMIFDQFEEFFFEYDQPTTRRSFYQFLGQSLATPFVKVVLSLREDYVHYLLECQRLIDLAIIDDNILDKKWLYYLGNFTPAEATTVISDLTEPTPYAPAADLVEQVVAELAEETEEVRPIELQIVGAQLQAENITTLAAYQGRGPNAKAALVQQYLTDVVTQCGPVEHQRLAELMLYLLTDAKGTRPRKTQANLAQDIQVLTHQAPLDDAAFALAIDILTLSGLVIHIPEAPEDRYQLVHDYLAAFIQQQQAPRLKEVMAELEQEKRQRQQAEAEREELAVANRKARRRLLLSSGLLVASIVGTVVAIPSAISAYAEAQKAFKQAQRDQQSAIEAQQDAKQARQDERDAEKAKREADEQAEAAEKRQKEAEEAEEEAKEEAKAAQAAMEEAMAAEGVALSEQQAAQRKAEEAQRKAEEAEQLLQTATAEAREARKQQAVTRNQQEVTKAGAALERNASNILSLSYVRLGQAQSLMDALKFGYTLQALLPRAKAEGNRLTLENYPARIPLLALRLTTNASTEQIKVSFGGDFQGFTPDGQGLVTLTYFLADPDSHRGRFKSRLWSLDGTEMATYEGEFRDFTPDEQGLVTYSSSEDKVRLWSLSGTEQASFEGEFLGFTLDEQGLVTYSNSKDEIRLWSLSGTEQATYKGSFLDFTPDGQGLVTYSNSEDESRLWSLSGTEMASYEGTFRGFTPDGQGLVTFSDSDGQSRLWSLSGTEVASYEGIFRDFTPDGQGLVTFSGIDGQSRLWSLSGSEIARYEGAFRSFTPDGQSILTYSQRDDKSRRYSFGGVELASYEGEFRRFTPNGQGLLTYSWREGKIRQWSLSGTEQASYSGEFQSFTSNGKGLIVTQPSETQLFYLKERRLFDQQLLAWTTDKKGLISYSESDGKSRLWNLNGIEKASFDGKFLSFTPDGKGLVTYSFSVINKSHLWRTNVTDPTDFEGEFHGFTPNGQGLVTYSNGEDKSRLWSMSGTEQASFEGKFQDFTPDRQGLVTYSRSEDKGHLWSMSGTEQASFEGELLSFTPNGQGFLTYSKSNGKLRLWSLSGAELASFEGEFQAFTPDGQGIITYWWGEDTSSLWSLGGTEQVIFEGGFRGFTPDGEGLVTYAGRDGKSRLWSLNGTEQASFEGEFLGLTPDEQGLVTYSSSDGKSRLWSLIGTEQASFEGEFRGFTPDGKGLATDSGYGTVLWSLSGERLAEFTGRLTTNSGIDFTRFSDDGQYLITFLDDTTHQIWQLDNGLDDLLARGCNLLANYFRANPDQREQLGICLDQPL